MLIKRPDIFAFDGNIYSAHSNQQTLLGQGHLRASVCSRKEVNSACVLMGVKMAPPFPETYISDVPFITTPNEKTKKRVLLNKNIFLAWFFSPYHNKFFAPLPTPLLVPSLSSNLGLLRLGLHLLYDDVNVLLLHRLANTSSQRSLLRSHHADLHVLGSRVDDLQKGAHCELDARGLVHVGLVVLLQKLPHALIVPSSNSVRLPTRVRSSGIGQVQLGLPPAEPRHHRRNSEGADSASLGVPLLRAGDVTGYVLDRRSILARQTVRLTLHPRLINQHSRVSRQTGETESHVLVYARDLADGAGVLEFSDGAFFYGEDAAAGAADADDGGTALDGLHGVLDLEEVTVGGEDGDGTVVAGEDGEGGGELVGIVGVRGIV